MKFSVACCFLVFLVSFVSAQDLSNKSIIGIIDTGIDVNGSDFKDSLGKTCILYLWDQKVKVKPQKSKVKDQLLYGKEWNSEEINKGRCSHKDTMFGGHGTIVSSIAAGAGKKYKGIAPNTELIVVALDFKRKGQSLFDAVKYICDKSAELKRPVVINVSIGDYEGSHDATDEETKKIEALISKVPGRVLVAAAGNTGNLKYHVKTKVKPFDTTFTWLRNFNREINYTFYADTAEVRNVRYAVGLTRTNYSSVSRTKFKKCREVLNSVKKDTLFSKKKKIGIIESSATINSYGVYELKIKIKTDSVGYLWSIESTGMGEFDSWNNSFANDDLPDAKIFPKIKKYVRPDSLSTLANGLACSKEVITVGNCNSALSSNGPARNKVIKPDICSYGSNLVSDLSTQIGGTSAAAAYVSGWIALYLNQNPSATNHEIKMAVVGDAFPDLSKEKIPNNYSGFGKFAGFKSGKNK